MKIENKFLMIFGLTIFLFFSIKATAQTLKLPFYEFDVGPCEFCLYGEWTAKADTNILKNRRSDAKTIFIVKSGEQVEAITGVVITIKAGTGKALGNTFLRKYNKRTDTYSDVPIRRNEQFFLLTYKGEGIYTVWYGGKILEAHFVDPNLKQISRPSDIWWVKIKNNRGQIGWTKMTRNFAGPKDP